MDKKYESNDVKPLTSIYKMGDKLRSSIMVKKNLNNSLNNRNNLEKYVNNSYEFGYIPKSEISKNSYDNILNLINNILGDTESEILINYTNNIIQIMKDPKINEIKKREKLDSIIKINEDDFLKFLTFSNNLSDFNAEANQENFINLGEDKIIEENYSNQDKSYDSSQENTVKKLSIEELKEDYLLKKLQLYMDKSQSEEIENKILSIFEINDDNSIQNELIELLMPIDPNFDLINFLFENKFLIFNSIKLYRAISPIDKEKFINILDKDDYGKLFLNKYFNKNEESNQEIKFIIDNETVNKYKEKLNFMDELSNNPDNITNQDLVKFDKNKFDFENFDDNIQNSNIEFRISKNSELTKYKGYEILKINNSSERPANNNKSVNILPDWARLAFKNINYFNNVQSKVIEFAFQKNENMLICAPTGSGKTNIALLAILKEIGLNIDNKTQNINYKGIKIVYIAPMKALVNEIIGNFKSRLEDYNLVIEELTGDSNTSKKQIENANIIVATPEKWDIITRKSENIISSWVKLLIIDEIHLLNDVRGSILECIISRTFKTMEMNNKLIRIVALSATLPNYKDVAEFLKIKDGLFYFDSSYRPIPLKQKFIGIHNSKSMKSNLLLNQIYLKEVKERVGKFQILTFVHSRKETFITGNLIKEELYSLNLLDNLIPENSQSKIILKTFVEQVNDKNLKELIEFGIGIHHAGLSKNDRKLVEDLYSQKHIQILISTATLAWGVNLPARCVIIKNTKVYKAELGDWTELSYQDVLQMWGRAGRPNLDTEGEGIIITNYEHFKFYLSLVNNSLDIESKLITTLIDNLNAEIVLENVSNLLDGVNWLKNTFLYVRMLKNQSRYLVENNDPYLIKTLTNLIHSAAVILSDNKLIKYNEKNGTFEKTFIGKISSYYYINYKTIKIYNDQISENMDLIDLLRIFSLSQEFKNIRIRQEEINEIEKFYKSVPIPVRTNIDEPNSKIIILLQCYISRLYLNSYVINSDMVYISQNSTRLLKGLFEIFLKKELYSISNIALNLYKMVEQRCWRSLNPLRQFSNINTSLIRKLEKIEGLTWEHLLNMSIEQISNIIKQNSQAHSIFNLVKKFPKFEIKSYLQPIDYKIFKIQFFYKGNFEWDDRILGKSQNFWIFVYDNNGEKIYYYKMINIKKSNYNIEQQINIFFKINIPYPSVIFVELVSDKYLNSSNCIGISLNNMKIDIQNDPIYKLDKYDLLINLDTIKEDYPLTYNFLKIKNYSYLYSHQYEIIKNINNTEDFFYGLQYNSGKILLTLFHIEKNIDKLKLLLFSDSNCWNNKYNILKEFAEYLNWNLINIKDKKWNEIKNNFLDSNSILITTINKFELISRNWKKKKNLLKIQKYILFDMHNINKNPKYEILVSRLKFIKTYFKINLNFIIFSFPVNNYKDLTDWLEIKNQLVFPASVNLKEGNYIFKSFSNSNNDSRLKSMVKYAFKCIKKDKKRVIIVVPERINIRDVSNYLIKELLYDNISSLFKNKEFNYDELDISDHHLKNILKYGIAYIRNNKKNNDYIIELFNINIINCLIFSQEDILKYNIYTNNLIYLDPYDYTNNSPVYSFDFFKIISKGYKLEDNNNFKIYIFINSSDKKYYEHIMNENTSVESCLNNDLGNAIVENINQKIITNYQEIINWLTWTFFYKRIRKNPIYYNIEKYNNDLINKYLSDLSENIIRKLSNTNCIEIENQSFMITNGGKISSYHGIDVFDIALFTNNINDDININILLEIISHLELLSNIKYRKGDNKIMEILAKHINNKNKPKDFNFYDKESKIYLILQSYFSKENNLYDFDEDLMVILKILNKNYQAIIDCLSINSNLKSLLLAIKFIQMLVWAVNNEDNSLLQIPFFNNNILKLCFNQNITNIDEFFSEDDDKRNWILEKFNKHQGEVIADFCNKLPIIELNHSKINKEYNADEKISISISLNREPELEEINRMRYNKGNQEIEEFHWLIIGDKEKNILFKVKKISLLSSLKLDIEFEIQEPGEYNLFLFLYTNCYYLIDQEFNLNKILIK